MSHATVILWLSLCLCVKTGYVCDEDASGLSVCYEPRGNGIRTISEEVR
jgi:hypothetical protein